MSNRKYIFIHGGFSIAILVFKGGLEHAKRRKLQNSSVNVLDDVGWYCIDDKA